MTCIVNYPTKKAFREAVAANAAAVRIEDPSIVAPYIGRLIPYLTNRISCVVTNHPKRSWYAEVVLGPKGLQVR